MIVFEYQFLFIAEKKGREQVVMPPLSNTLF